MIFTGILCIRFVTQKLFLNDDAKLHVIKHINGTFSVKSYQK